MNTTLFPQRRANEWRHAHSRRFRRSDYACASDEFDDDDGAANRWFDSHDWDEVDDDEFDPEPSDEELGDDFDLDQIPDETQRPPEELWNDADWE